MIAARRKILGIGGGLLAALSLPPPPAGADGVIEIRMQGRPDGSQVWFDPIGIRIAAGQTLRWINLDPGNAHTATAYAPANFDRPRRIPANAEAWNSDYLLPNETFTVTLTERGVHDYYCVPHEHAGMVGRIVVDAPLPGGWLTAADDDGLPEAALRAFPAIEAIMRDGIVRRS
jgi:plastocyanin